MKYEVKPSNQFKKDLKLAARRGYKIDLLSDVIKKLANGEELEPNIKTINYPVVLDSPVNVIFNLIGC